MNIVGGILGWISRHLLVFLLLIAALTLYSQARQSHLSAQSLSASVASLAAANAQLHADIAALGGTSVTALTTAEQASLKTIDARITAARADQARHQASKRSGLDLLTAPREAIIANGRADIAITVGKQEIAFLQKLRAIAIQRDLAAPLDARIADLEARIAGDTANLSALSAKPYAERFARDGLRIIDLAAAYTARRTANRAVLAAVRADRRRIGDITHLAVPAVAIARLEPLLAPLEAATARQSRTLESTLQREARRQYDRLGVGNFITPALWALLAIIVTPFAIRTLFFWVLAPLASLQRPIRLLEAAAPIPVPPGSSKVSRSIDLIAAEELLIKQGFVQSVAHSGSKATKLLLDNHFPLTSLAAGLAFLTRVRGEGTTTVSAIRDPFAEIAILDLPAGSACVLQPRAVAGVVQPIAAPLRITSHWRLGTLNAWLTWQLRFLVFHGPARIILTGGRGVCIEPAQSGRSIGQDQLIGFSAGLAYSTGRTETFLPYLLGQESLLKDRIAAGTGLLIAEEAPMAGRRTAAAKGLEGAADALLKVFGI